MKGVAVSDEIYDWLNAKRTFDPKTKKVKTFNEVLYDIKRIVEPESGVAKTDAVSQE